MCVPVVLNPVWCFTIKAGLTLLENFRWTSASSWRLFFSWVQASPRVLWNLHNIYRQFVFSMGVMQRFDANPFTCASDTKSRAGIHLFIKLYLWTLIATQMFERGSVWTSQAAPSSSEGITALTLPLALPGGSATAWKGSWRIPPQSLSWNTQRSAPTMSSKSKWFNERVRWFQRCTAARGHALQRLESKWPRCVHVNNLFVLSLLYRTKQLMPISWTDGRSARAAVRVSYDLRVYRQ